VPRARSSPRSSRRQSRRRRNGEPNELRQPAEGGRDVPVAIQVGDPLAGQLVHRNLGRPCKGNRLQALTPLSEPNAASASPATRASSACSLSSASATGSCRSVAPAAIRSAARLHPWGRHDSQPMPPRSTLQDATWLTGKAFLTAVRAHPPVRDIGETGQEALMSGVPAGQQVVVGATGFEPVTPSVSANHRGTAVRTAVFPGRARP
jgi:hypothetical protein